MHICILRNAQLEETDSLEFFTKIQDPWDPAHFLGAPTLPLK